MDADDVMTCPAGVALLEALEAAQRTDMAWFQSLTTADPSAIERAAATTASITWGQLLAHVVGAAERIGGPWQPDAIAHLGHAFRHAPARRPIAEAIAARLAAAPREIERDVQEWWLGATSGSVLRPAFGGSLQVYCCGEFTRNGIWTVTSPPPEVHVDLIGVWELVPGPISRWRIPIRSDARVFEVNRPADWSWLVTSFPFRASAPHAGWEFPGPNQPGAEAPRLELVSGGRAIRTAATVFMPDWAAVAEVFDGVHLSWTGMLACEGRMIDLPALGEDAVSMVRYWGSERTIWLNDVFGAPSPCAAPVLTGRINGVGGIEASDPERRGADVASMAAQLARDPFDH